MAEGFWGSIIQGLLGAGGLALSAKIGQREISGEEKAALNELSATTRQQRQFATAAITPDDPLFKNLSGLMEERAKRDLAHSLNELMKRSRKEVSRGYGPLLNPARRDEARSQAISRGFVQAGEGARDETRRSLLAASGSVGAAAPALAQQINILANQSQQEAQRRAGLVSGGFDMLDALRANFFPTPQENMKGDLAKSIISYNNRGRDYGRSYQPSFL